MINLFQTPPFLIVRAVSLFLSNRVHFPKEKIGKIIREEEDFVIFRQVFVRPSGDQPKSPGAIFKVCFHFANFSENVNKMLSLIPIPFIIAQPGFRSKTWMLGRKTGLFQGLYEWDTIKDAENYWTSFPMALMKKRAVPESLKYSITKVI